MHTSRNYLIIGATSGIGYCLAELLLAQNATVLAASRRGAIGLPPGVKGIFLDTTTDFELPPGFLPEKLHGLVYCPGSINLKPMQRITSADLAAEFNLNVVGALRCIQACHRSLKAAGNGSIVLFSSVAAQTGMPFHAGISAAKGGLEGMARALAAEFAPSRIRVNVVAPSLTETPLAAQLINTPEKIEAGAKRHPLGRIGNVDDAAQAALYLLSAQAGWVTGQTLRVDGGMSTIR